MAATSRPTSPFDVLIDPGAVAVPAVVAITGSPSYLQHEVRRALAAQLLGGDAGEALVLDGRAAAWSEVRDCLAERSLFGAERRVVVVEGADALIKAARELVERYVAAPSADATLILEVESLPGNTRLAKAILQSGQIIACQIPDKGRELSDFQRRLAQWLEAAAPRDFDATLARGATEALLELVPPEPGVLYQEVARLALLGPGGKIDAALVRQHVGGWRAQKTWDMIDAAAAGDAPEALAQLDRLLAAGEDPHGLLPQMAATLRKMALAVAIIESHERRGARCSLRDALQQAGVPPFKLADAEQQLRQLGRQRARRLLRWLLQSDLDLKGHNSPKDRARRVLETVILRLSRQAATA